MARVVLVSPGRRAQLSGQAPLPPLGPPLRRALLNRGLGPRPPLLRQAGTLLGFGWARPRDLNLRGSRRGREVDLA
eukprot:2711419-Alexandrium_andersonii.AAC.1